MLNTRLFSAVLVTVFLCIALLSFPGLVHAGEDDNLFVAAGRPGSWENDLRESRGMSVFRSNAVRPRFELLDRDSTHPLELNLFNDMAYTAVLDRAERLSPDRLTWIGHIENIPGSEVILVKGGGVLIGKIRLPWGVYRIAYDGRGIHRVEEVNLAALPPEAPPVRIAPDTSSVVAPDHACDGEDGSIITVLVAYTTEAKIAAGGTDAMVNSIQLGVSEANQGFLNSGVNQRVALVHTMEVNYSEGENFDWAGTHFDLVKGRNSAFQDIHQLRDDFGADVVSLVVSDTGLGGIGSLMDGDELSVDFAPYAFSLVTYIRVVTNYTMAHEWGHNMGCMHDRANSGYPGAYQYSFGYQVPGHFRTIMAYSCNQETEEPCPRVNHWSNPDVDYEGVPTGINQGEQGSADNRLTLNNTAPIVANFRPPVIFPPAFENRYGFINSREGGTMNLDFSASPYNPGEVILYSIANAPEGVSFNTETGAFNWTPTYNQGGTYNITFSASAGGGIANQTVTFNVANVKKIKK